MAECDICREEYDDESRIPLKLFCCKRPNYCCFTCIEARINSTASCFYCKMRWSIRSFVNNCKDNTPENILSVLNKAALSNTEEVGERKYELGSGHLRKDYEAANLEIMRKAGVKSAEQIEDDRIIAEKFEREEEERMLKKKEIEKQDALLALNWSNDTRRNSENASSSSSSSSSSKKNNSSNSSSSSNIFNNKNDNSNNKQFSSLSKSNKMNTKSINSNDNNKISLMNGSVSNFSSDKYGKNIIKTDLNNGSDVNNDTDIEFCRNDTNSNLNKNRILNLTRKTNPSECKPSSAMVCGKRVISNNDNSIKSYYSNSTNNVPKDTLLKSAHCMNNPNHKAVARNDNKINNTIIDFSNDTDDVNDVMILNKVNDRRSSEIQESFSILSNEGTKMNSAKKELIEPEISFSDSTEKKNGLFMNNTNPLPLSSSKGAVGKRTFDDHEENDGDNYNSSHSIINSKTRKKISLTDDINDDNINDNFLNNKISNKSRSSTSNNYNNISSNASKREEIKWNCSFCTYSNNPLYLCCEICMKVKPRPCEMLPNNNTEENPDPQIRKLETKKIAI